MNTLVNHLATYPYFNNLDIESHEALILAHVPLFNAVFLTLKQQQLQKELESLKPKNYTTLCRYQQIIKSKENNLLHTIALWYVKQAKSNGTLQAYDTYRAKFNKLAHTERLTKKVHTVMAVAWPVLTIAVPLCTFLFFNPLSLSGLCVILGTATPCLLSCPLLEKCRNTAETCLILQTGVIPD